MRCSGCGEVCRIVTIDNGVGYGEFWGVPFYDRQLFNVSNCCEAPIEERVSF